MIYNKPLTVCKPLSGVWLDTELEPVMCRYAADLTVYAARYWEAVQAGSRVDRLVQFPRTAWDRIEADWIVLYGDNTYRIEQAQQEFDEDNLPVWRLSLRRPDGFYNAAGVNGGGGSDT